MAEEKNLKMDPYKRYPGLAEVICQKTDGEQEQTLSLLRTFLKEQLEQLERDQNQDITEVLIRKRIRELDEGLYGEKIQKLFGQIEKNERYQIAHRILVQEKTGESISLFCQICEDLIPKGFLFRNHFNPEVLLFYIPVEADYHVKTLLSLLQDLFLPFGYVVKEYTKESFTLLTEKEAAKIGSTRLY